MDKKFYIENTEWAQELEQGLDSYLDSLWEALDNESDDPNAEIPVTTESEEYFCGCSTCVTREILFYVTPRIIEGYLAKYVTLVTLEQEQ